MSVVKITPVALEREGGGEGGLFSRHQRRVAQSADRLLYVNRTGDGGPVFHGRFLGGQIHRRSLDTLYRCQAPLDLCYAGSTGHALYRNRDRCVVPTGRRATK